MTHTTAALKKALAIREKIDALEIELSETLFGPSDSVKELKSIIDSFAGGPANTKKKRKMSPEGRAAIVAAQKARWAKKKAK